MRLSTRPYQRPIFEETAGIIERQSFQNLEGCQVLLSPWRDDELTDNDGLAGHARILGYGDERIGAIFQTSLL